MKLACRGVLLALSFAHTVLEAMPYSLSGHVNRHLHTTNDESKSSPQMRGFGNTVENKIASIWNTGATPHLRGRKEDAPKAKKAHWTRPFTAWKENFLFFKRQGTESVQVSVPEATSVMSDALNTLCSPSSLSILLVLAIAVVVGAYKIVSSFVSRRSRAAKLSLVAQVVRCCATSAAYRTPDRSEERGRQATGATAPSSPMPCYSPTVYTQSVGSPPQLVREPIPMVQKAFNELALGEARRNVCKVQPPVKVLCASPENNLGESCVVMLPVTPEPKRNYFLGEWENVEKPYDEWRFYRTVGRPRFPKFLGMDD